MPKTFFSIEMLPAEQGDALWIEYGTARNKHRILIDGGPIKAYTALEKKLKALPDGDQGVELLVTTHVDTDHIEGIIRLLATKKNDWLIEPEDIWFNGYRHLKKTGMLGGREGDFLSALIRQRAPDKWNTAFKGKAVLVNPGKPLPVIKLGNTGMKITLLSPYPDNLLEMASKWETDVDKFGLKPGDLEQAWEQLAKASKYKVAAGMLGGTDEFGLSLEKQLKVDQSLANGTSIAFLAEYKGKSCLFLADAHHDVICKSLKKLIPAGRKRLKVNAVKMSHHGSRSNISKELMELIDARHFLISTSGAIYQHPDKSAIDAVIQWSLRAPVLWFNYRSEQNEEWANLPRSRKKSVTAHYPGKKEGIKVDL